MIKKFYYATAQIRAKMSHPHNLAHNHYVLEYEKDHVRVFTTKPIPGINNKFVSNITIEGKEQPQYLSGYIYKVDSKNVILSDIPEVQQYLKANPTLVCDAINEAQNLPIIDIAIHLLT